MLDHRMETFLTVCETMNFTKAAAKLHIYAACCVAAYPLFGSGL